MTIQETKTPFRRAVVILSSLALLGAGGTWMLNSQRGPSAGSNLADGDAETRGKASRFGFGRDKAEEAPCAFADGTRMAYDVTTRSHSKIDMSGLMDQIEVGGQQMAAQATDVDQKATRRWHLDLEVVAKTAGGSAVLAAHIDAQPADFGVGEPVPPLPQLADTFLVEVNPQCAIEQFGWRSDGNREATRDQQQLLASLNYLAPQPGEDGASGMVFDAVGHYYATYGLRDDGRLVGRAVEYKTPFGKVEAGIAPTFDVEASVIEVAPAPGVWFESLNNERTVTLTMYDTSVGTVTGSVVAHRAEVGDWRPAVDVSDGGWTWGVLLGQFDASTQNEALTNSELAGVAAHDIVDQYLALVADSKNALASTQLLTEWLQANPEGARDLLKFLQEGVFDDNVSASSRLFLALSVANTDQANAVLVDIVEGAVDAVAHRVSAAHALAQVRAPNESMLDAVVALAEDGELHSVARGSAAMSLGAFANRQAQRAPELAEKAREHIQGWLDEPADDEELRGSIAAAGNAGHDELATSLDRYLEHEDPQIRQRAATAMRHMSPDEAFPRLSSGMGDDDPSVRASAIETATKVSRATKTAPPEAMVDQAIEQLDLRTPQREQKALLSFLGEAAKRGNEGAEAVLQQHFDDEMASHARDVNKLRALGRFANSRWRAE